MIIISRSSTYFLLTRVKFGDVFEIESKQISTSDTVNKKNFTGKLDNLSFSCEDITDKTTLENFILTNWGKQLTIDNFLNKRRLLGVILSYDFSVGREDERKKSLGVSETVKWTYYNLVFEFAITSFVNLTQSIIRTNYPVIYRDYRDLINTLP